VARSSYQLVSWSGHLSSTPQSPMSKIPKLLFHALILFVYPSTTSCPSDLPCSHYERLTPLRRPYSKSKAASVFSWCSFNPFMTFFPMLFNEKEEPLLLDCWAVGRLLSDETELARAGEIWNVFAILMIWIEWWCDVVVTLRIVLKWLEEDWLIDWLICVFDVLISDDNVMIFFFCCTGDERYLSSLCHLQIFSPHHSRSNKFFPLKHVLRTTSSKFFPSWCTRWWRIFDRIPLSCHENVFVTKNTKELCSALPLEGLRGDGAENSKLTPGILSVHDYYL